MKLRHHCNSVWNGSLLFNNDAFLSGRTRCFQEGQRCFRRDAEFLLKTQSFRSWTPSEKTWRQVRKIESIFNRLRHGLKNFIPIFRSWTPSEKVDARSGELNPSL